YGQLHAATAEAQVRCACDDCRMRYLFIVPPTLFIAALHAYLWRRLVCDTGLTARARSTATLLIVVLWALFPATFIVWLRLNSAHPVQLALAFGWLGAVGYAAAILAAWDGVRVFSWIARRARGWA